MPMFGEGVAAAPDTARMEAADEAFMPRDASAAVAGAAVAAAMKAMRNHKMIKEIGKAAASAEADAKPGSVKRSVGLKSKVKADPKKAGKPKKSTTESEGAPRVWSSPQRADTEGDDL